MNNEFENNNFGEEEENFFAETEEITENEEETVLPDMEDVPKKKKRILPRVVIFSLLAGVLFGVAFGAANSLISKYMASKIKIETTNVTFQKGESDVAGTSDIAAITEECMPSIVAITNRGVTEVMTFFGTYAQESTSSGSGIIIGKNDTELLVVTNYHVVANSKELSVVFSPVEKMIEAEAEEKGTSSVSVDSDLIPKAVVKGYDADRDVAVIAIKLADIPESVSSQIKIATIGDSNALRAGDGVIAIGNSLGYGQSVTTGIVSAVNRKVTMKNAEGTATVTNAFIQTDAAINSGNSGGALLDMAGHVIGINSVKIATTGVEGMGYAIPISQVEEIIGDLMTRQTRSIVDEKEQGFLGITGVDVTAENNETFGMPVGVFVNSVIEGLAADKAGIKRGYIITKLDGYSVSTIAQLQERLRYYKDGEKVVVTVQIPENNKYTEKEFTAVLSNRAENTEE